MRRKWGEEDNKKEGEEQGDGEEEAVVEKLLEGV